MVDTPRPGVAEAGPSSGPAAGRAPELRKGEDRVLSGVCSGLGEYTGVDPIVWRTAFVLTAFAGATGLLLYIAAWMLMRDTAGGPSTLEQMLNRAFPSAVVLKLLASGLLLATLMSLVGGFGWGTMVLATPLIIGLLSARNRGVDLRSAFLEMREEMRRAEPAPSVPDPERSPSYYNPAQPWASAPPGPVDLAVVSERTSAGAGSEDGGEEAEGPQEGGGGVGGGPRQEACGGWPLAATVWWVLLAVAVLFPMLFLGEGSSFWSGETVRLLVGPETGVFFLAGALALVGVLAIAGTWWGNTAGLWGLGVLFALLVATVSVADLTRVGAAAWEPRTVAELEGGEYRMTLGSGVLDLRMLRDLEPGEPVEAQVSANGHLQVLLPEDARVEMDSWVGAGGVEEDGRAGPSGVGVEFHRVYEPVEEDGGGADGEKAGPPVIELRTDTYVGHVEVQHGRSED